jgi:phage shock protein PspC (stress-responsive transcriptional regulator)
MSTPYPPQPRRLMRDPSKKLIGGVCSGLAKYLNMDVTLVRILTVVISLFTGVPIVLYLIALFVMPEEGTTPPQPPHVNGPQPGAYDAGFGGQGSQPAYGAPAQPPADQVWGPAGAPWEQPQSAAQPAASTTAPTPQTWTQPSAPEPTVVDPTGPEPTSTEPTGYDTAPVTPAADTGTDEAGTDKKD